MCPTESAEEQRGCADSADSCIKALQLLNNGDPGFMPLLEQCSEAGCKEAMFFSGAIRYRAMGNVDPAASRLLNDSGREGYSLYEFLSTYPADIEDFFNGKKGFDEGLLNRTVEWFSLSPEQKEYFRKRALSRYGDGLYSDGRSFFNTPTKYSDWIEWKSSKGDLDATYSMALDRYENREYETSLELLNLSETSGLEEIYLAGKCYLGLSRDEAALDKFRLAAGKGHPGACYEIFLIHERGCDKISDEEVKNCLKTAVSNNIRKATNTMFEIYLSSPADRSDILNLFSSAFEKGNYDARAYEGFIHFYGIGKEKNPEKALYCFEDVYRRCQYSGYVGFLLGYMYTNGIGCERHEKRGRSMIGCNAIPGMSPEECLEHIRRNITERRR